MLLLRRRFQIFNRVIRSWRQSVDDQWSLPVVPDPPPPAPPDTPRLSFRRSERYDGLHQRLRELLHQRWASRLTHFAQTVYARRRTVRTGLLRQGFRTTIAFLPDSHRRNNPRAGATNQSASANESRVAYPASIITLF